MDGGNSDDGSELGSRGYAAPAGGRLASFGKSPRWVLVVGGHPANVVRQSKVEVAKPTVMPSYELWGAK